MTNYGQSDYYNSPYLLQTCQSWPQTDWRWPFERLLSGILVTQSFHICCGCNYGKRCELPISE